PPLVVERGELLRVMGAADDDVVSGDAIIVEGVQRLAELEHDVVRDIDNVVDRPLAERDQALLHPLGRRRDLDPFYDRRQVATAQVRRLNLHRYTAFDLSAALFVIERRLAYGLARQRGDLAGDAEDGQP